jgi:hypothetical protein
LIFIQAPVRRLFLPKDAVVAAFLPKDDNAQIYLDRSDRHRRGGALCLSNLDRLVSK